MKPHIVRNKVFKCWMCVYDRFIANGKTPIEAYNHMQRVLNVSKSTIFLGEIKKYKR